ncbi:hypothetical protein G6514_002309 [Epicoccum nigrum]|nr:hypothetical protein G6514_002309 [Epicoccum nigrum]
MPAIWSDMAKARTRQAVDKAGFNSAQFPGLREIIDVTEPECAAIYTMHSLRETVHDSMFTKGDGFIVCDMSGGTVHLISYEILTTEPTRIQEVTVGTGGQCGGSFVDWAFLRWLEGRLGTEDFIKVAGCRADSLPRTMLSKKAARMTQNFILEVKGGFSGTENYTLQLPSPLSAIEDDEARASKMARSRLEGGFSESPYMYKKIQEWATNHGTKAIRPTYAWSAVVRGAVTKGLQGDMSVVASRKNRRHYGIVITRPFKSDEHLESDSYINIYDGTKRADHQMKWLLKQGRDLPTSEAATPRSKFTMRSGPTMRGEAY